jgi:outer membrane protein OmpA-like peptidoglycan-associated protein
MFIQKNIIAILLMVSLPAVYSTAQEKKPTDSLSTNINTPADEFHPTLSGDGKYLVYASRRGDGKTSNIYMSRNKNSLWESPLDMEKLNSGKDDVTPFISYDGSMIVFSSNREGGDPGGKKENYNLYVSFRVGDHWIEPVKLSDDVNTAENESAPSLSKENNILYFTRWPAGEPEKSNIYRATLTDNGFSNVEKLPEVINSGNSEFSFVPSRKREGFYFSSGRPGGYGSRDIYFVYHKLGSFGNPVNLGEKVNSEMDDIYVSEMEDDTIYYSSNKKGGVGNYDIYTAKIPKEFSETKVAETAQKDVEDEKETGFSFKVIEKKTGNPLSVEFELTLKSGEKDGDKKTVLEKSDPSGMLSLITDREISEVSIKSLSRDHRKMFKTYAVEKGVMKDIGISLEKKRVLKKVTDIEDDLEITPLDFKPIYFDSNSTKVRLEYIPYLYGIVSYMRKNENVRLKIIGHSGLRGSCKISTKVSLGRARRVRDYILSFGIDKERLVVKGLGKRFPADSRYNEVNRRVEFQVME